MSEEKPRVLVVDDDPTVLDVLAHMLKKVGCEGAGASNGMEAFGLFQRQAFDLILTDIKMPVLSGLGLIERVRAKDQEIPIIIMTAHADLRSAREALRHRVFDYLMKPFESPVVVESAVRRALKEKRERASADELRQEIEKLEKQYGEWRSEAEKEMKALVDRLSVLSSLAQEHVKQIEVLLEGLGCGLIVTDTTGAIAGMNQEMRKLMGVPGSGAAGTGLDQLQGNPEIRAGILESRSKIEPGKVSTALVETSDPEHHPLQFEVESRQLLDESNKPFGILTVVRPVKRSRSASKRAAFEETDGSQTEA